MSKTIDYYKISLKKELENLTKNNPQLADEKNLNRFMSHLKKISASSKNIEHKQKALSLYNTLLYLEGEI